MTAFSVAIDVLFNDPNISVGATYTPPVSGPPVTCRVILDNADQEIKFGAGRQFDAGLTIEVRVSEIAAPARGGSFAVGNTTYSILDDPMTSDPDRLVWKCTVK